MDIIVRVYSNLEGMANYLVKLDKVRNLGQLRAFSTGFCGRISSFDWIDTGVGQEGGAGRKVRGQYQFSTFPIHFIAYVHFRKSRFLRIKLSFTTRPCSLFPYRLARAALQHPPSRQNHINRIDILTSSTYRTTYQNHQTRHYFCATTATQESQAKRPRPRTRPWSKWAAITAYAARRRWWRCDMVSHTARRPPLTEQKSRRSIEEERE